MPTPYQIKVGDEIKIKGYEDTYVGVVNLVYETALDIYWHTHPSGPRTTSNNFSRFNIDFYVSKPAEPPKPPNNKPFSLVRRYEC